MGRRRATASAKPKAWFSIPRRPSDTTKQVGWVIAALSLALREGQALT